MGQLEVTGSDTAIALEQVLSRSPRQLETGQAQYALMLNASGGTIDDVMVYRLAPHRYLLIVNAANEEKDWSHLTAQIPATVDATAANSSAQFGLLALQGPASEQILQWLCDSDLSRLAPRHVLPTTTVAGQPTVVARGGYSGEDGFELLAAADLIGEIWDGIVAAGRPHGLELAGLGARDTLRLEASLPLYGHELDERTSPLHAGLGGAVDKSGSYLGGAATEALRTAGLERRLRMLQLQGRAVARQGAAVQRDGAAVGSVTSGSFSPTLERPIAMAYIATGAATVGDTVEVIVRGRGQVARVIERPFYRRKTNNERNARA